MADRPILFSAPMVRAILAGQKTQTRRPLRAGTWWTREHGVVRMAPAGPACTGFAKVPCPYGEPGDRLWVREAHMDLGACYLYRADPGAETERALVAPGQRWKPAIHMPRAASRITLEVTGVRVERLQAISEADALAEGVTPKWEPGCSGRLMEAFSGFSFRPAASAYADLWEQINGPGSWSENAWVWVVSFKVVAS